MSRLLVQLCFVTALVTVGFAESPPTIIGQTGQKVILPLFSKLKYVYQVDLVSNDNVYYCIYKKSDYDYGNYTNSNRIRATDGYVPFIRQLSNNDTGTWTINMKIILNDDENNDSDESSYYNSYESMEEEEKKEIVKHTVQYNVIAYQKVNEYKASPSPNFKVLPDRKISAEFPEVIENITRCNLQDNQNFLYSLEKPIELSNVERTGGCGVIMHINSSHSGSWALIANTENGEVHRATFSIDVLNPEKYKPLNKVKYVDLGSQNYRIVAAQNALSCELEDPQGRKYGVQNGKCELNIDRFTQYYEGVWKVTYTVFGVDNLLEDTVTLLSRNTQNTNETVTVANNGSIHLLCSTNSQQFLYCNFIRPDGRVMNMLPGVGNSEYTYFGSPNNHRFTDVVKRECGITILNPKKYDFGPWKCNILSHDDRQVRGGILRVEEPNSNKKLGINVGGHDIVVKLEESFRVKCHADARLNYCWLKSPNGTIYSVSNYENSGTTLQLLGLGLSFGECEAIIDEASTDHAGAWTCHMGIENGTEVTMPFNVDITDYRLMSPKSIIVTDNVNSKQLTCLTLPDREDAIEFCRWVSPHGLGINVEHGRKYLTEIQTRECSLTINELNDEDFGKWTCFARLSGIEDEQSTTIMLTQLQTVTTGIYITIAATIALLLAVVIAILVYVILRRRSQMDDTSALTSNMFQEVIVTMNSKPVV